MQWWQALIIMGAGFGITILAVLVGGWLVFRDKTIMSPMPFYQPVKKDKDKKPYSYVSDLYTDDKEGSFEDEHLSPAAARLRDQKMTEKDKVFAVVTGKK